MRCSIARSVVRRPICRRPIVHHSIVRCSIAASPLFSQEATSTAAFADATDFAIVSQKVTVDRAASTANFSLTFNRDPVFVSSGDSQSDAFQYEIDVNSTDFSHPLTASTVDAVIRGGEIWEGRGIPVRFPTGDGGHEAGGWGPVRALLPFDLNGSTVTFTAPLADFGDSNGKFRYRAIATENGALTTQSVGAVIPLPASIWSGLILLGAVSIGRKLRILQRI